MLAAAAHVPVFGSYSSAELRAVLAATPLF